MKKELIEKDVLEGGCGRSAEELEFSAVVVACCVIGYLILISIAIIGELLA